MNEDQLRRIREFEERSEELQRERRGELRQSFHHLGDLDGTVSAAWKVAFWGAIPSFVWIIREGLLRGSEQMTEGFSTIVIGLSGVGITLCAAPTPCAIIAHFWFRNSIVPARVAAITLTLLADTAMMGWVVYLTSAK